MSCVILLLMRNMVSFRKVLCGSLTLTHEALFLIPLFIQLSKMYCSPTEFSYIAINNHLTSVAFPGIIPELRCLFFCTECIIECFVHIILSNHMGTPILFYVLLELGSALGVGFSEDERFLQLQIVGTIARVLR